MTIDRGHGAFVLDGTWDETTSDSPFVIDPLGKAYQLVDAPITLEKLSYDAEEAPVVPDEWVALFDRGVALSTCAALCPPADQPGEPQPARTARSCRSEAGPGRRRGAGASLVACPAARADDGDEADCLAIPAEDPTHYATSQPSLPLLEMGVDDALERLKRQHVQPGAGVTVAVIDSGVASGAPITIAGTPVETGNKETEPVDYHGTAVAGLIAGHPRPDGGGPVGIAPGARIFDVQVYDEADASTAPDSTQSPITVENLRLGLDAVIAAVPAYGIRIVNISLAIPDDTEIRAKIAQLWSMGVVVVAPTGNRSPEQPGDLPSTFEAHRPVRTPRRTSTRPTTTTCSA